jgi:hypothetical protein
VQWHYISGDNQLWKIEVVPDTTDIVRLINVHSLSSSGAGKLVTVPANRTGVGAELQLWSDTNSDLQKWQMIRL